MNSIGDITTMSSKRTITAALVFLAALLLGCTTSNNTQSAVMQPEPDLAANTGNTDTITRTPSGSVSVDRTQGSIPWRVNTGEFRRHETPEGSIVIVRSSDGTLDVGLPGNWTDVRWEALPSAKGEYPFVFPGPGAHYAPSPDDPSVQYLAAGPRWTWGKETRMPTPTIDPVTLEVTEEVTTFAYIDSDRQQTRVDRSSFTEIITQGTQLDDLRNRTYGDGATTGLQVQASAWVNRGSDYRSNVEVANDPPGIHLLDDIADDVEVDAEHLEAGGKPDAAPSTGDGA